jgi:hypothetical protein
MRIAIDARELSGKSTGVGRYLAQILTAWGELPRAAAHEYVLCSPEPIMVPGTLRASVVTAPGRRTLWEQRALPRLAAGSDVLFAPGYSGPLRSPVPMVITIHDVSFAAHPEWFSWREVAHDLAFREIRHGNECLRAAPQRSLPCRISRNARSCATSGFRNRGSK